MVRYFVDEQAQANGDHEVHKQGCAWLATAEQTKDLGQHLSCHAAVLAARRWFPKANGCARCSAACHTT